ncbi:MAG: DUF2993 domain-containing protein [Streptosporangiales bacterium]|nr:DUF2993 domain-containing protein [Streptosporangiales bacterium]
MRKLVIFLVVLLALVIVGDWGLKQAAEREIAKRVAAKVRLTEPPEVTIDGYPFLTQMLSGRYESIHLVSGQISRGEVRVKSLDVRLNGVTAPLEKLLANSGDSITATSATATALVPYGEVQRRVPEGLTVAPAGEFLQLSGEFSVAGVKVPVKSKLKLKVTRRGIVAVPKEVQVGRFPASAVRNRLGFTVPLRELPMKLKVTGVKVTPGGLQVNARGTQVALSGGNLSGGSLEEGTSGN